LKRKPTHEEKVIGRASDAVRNKIAARNDESY